MKAILFKEEILKGIQKAASIIPIRTGAAFLRTIWLENNENKLKIMSTDSKLEFSGTYSVQTQEEGLIGVPGRNFFELLRKLPAGEMTLASNEQEQTLLVEQGKRKFKLPIFDPSWFQAFSAFPEEKAVKWSGEFLKELIDRVVYCISDDDSDPMHYMKMAPAQEESVIESCGLNGHQFAMQCFTHGDLYGLLGQEGILIAKPYLQELKKWLSTEELYFTIDEKRLFFTNKNKNEVFSLPINFYNFPKYELFLSYFDTDTSEMTVDKEEFLDALERIVIFNTETQRCTYFVFDDQELILYAQGQDTGEATETISVEFKGDLNKIVFPTKNLIEILQHFQSPQLTFIYTSSEGPCKIYGKDDPDYTVVIMPVAIEEETYYTEEHVEQE